MAWAGGRAYQKLKADHESLVASQLNLANSMAEKWKSHDEEIRRLIESQKILADQLTELIRHDVRLDNYHKRIQRLEDNEVKIEVMVSGVTWIKEQMIRAHKQ